MGKAMAEQFPPEVGDVRDNHRFDPSKFSDRYEDALKALIQAKQAGKPLPEAPARPTNVINLMDALRKSIESEKPTQAAKRPPAPSTKRQAKSNKGGQ